MNTGSGATFQPILQADTIVNTIDFRLLAQSLLRTRIFVDASRSAVEALCVLYRNPFAS